MPLMWSNGQTCMSGLVGPPSPTSDESVNLASGRKRWRDLASGEPRGTGSEVSPEKREAKAFLGDGES